MAKMMPMEATGPRVELDFRSLNSRHSRPAMTVLPEASTGSTVARMALRVAVALSRYLRSSSR